VRRRHALAKAMLVAALPWLAAGCEKQEADRGQDARNLVEDTQVLEEASAAANDVVHNASDCDAVKAALPETKRRLEEAGKRVRTQSGRKSLDALNKQVANVAGACP
jgi:hypothetical protein